MGIGVVSGQLCFAMNNGIDGAGFPGSLVYFIQEGDYRLFVRNSHIDPQPVRSTQALDKLPHFFGGYFPGLVRGVKSKVIQSRLLEGGRYGMSDGKSYYSEF